MKNFMIDKIKRDLRESRLNWKLALFFIPIAFFTYLFHEFGHWIVGELLGNEMTLGLNISAPRNAYFLKQSHALWSSIGGPAFTILLALLFLLITQKTKSGYAYSVLFFAAFTRFFSLFFGGFQLQDEARISSSLGINEYIIPIVVLLILTIIVRRGTQLMNLNLKAVGYYTVVSTLANLFVIGVNSLI